MELQLTEREFLQAAVWLDCTTSREETMEMIVPDAYPDILQIIDTSGTCLVQRREIQEQGVMVSGIVRLNLLYQPDRDVSPRILSTELPFQHITEGQSPTDEGKVIVHCWLSHCESRMMNPRKILFRIEIQEQIQGYVLQRLQLPDEIKEGQRLGIQQRNRHYQATVTSMPTEKSFTAEDTILLPDRGAGKGTVIRCSPSVMCMESKIVGTKLMFKGCGVLELLLQTEQGELFQHQAQLVFSQILDTAGFSEEGQYQLELQLLDWSLEQDDGEIGQLSVSLEVLAQAVYYQTESVSLLNDAYGVSGQMDLIFEEAAFRRVTACYQQRQSFRDYLALDQEVLTVLGGHMELSPLNRGGERLTASGELTILYYSEDGQLRSIQKRISLELNKNVPQQDQQRERLLLRQLELVAAAGGIEVRYTAEIHQLGWQSFHTAYIKGGSLKAEPQERQEDKPSLILRKSFAQEELWDIAKEYRTDCDEMKELNHLMEDRLTKDQILLIPKTR